MSKEHETCAYEKVYAVRFQNLADDLKEVKERVHALENTLSRGVMLLIANLAGVIVTLLKGFLGA